MTCDSHDACINAQLRVYENATSAILECSQQNACGEMKVNSETNTSIQCNGQNACLRLSASVSGSSLIDCGSYQSSCGEMTYSVFGEVENANLICDQYMESSGCTEMTFNCNYTAGQCNVDIDCQEDCDDNNLYCNGNACSSSDDQWFPIIGTNLATPAPPAAPTATPPGFCLSADVNEYSNISFSDILGEYAFEGFEDEDEYGAYYSHTSGRQIYPVTTTDTSEKYYIFYHPHEVTDNNISEADLTDFYGYCSITNDNLPLYYEFNETGCNEWVFGESRIVYLQVTGTCPNLTTTNQPSGSPTKQPTQLPTKSPIVSTTLAEGESSEDVAQQTDDAEMFINDFFQIALIIIASFFGLLVCTSYIIAKYIWINDFFKISSIITAALHIMDMNSDLFFTISAGFNNMIICILSALFIIIPVSVSNVQLWRHMVCTCTHIHKSSYKCTKRKEKALAQR